MQEFEIDRGDEKYDKTNKQNNPELAKKNKFLVIATTFLLWIMFTKLFGLWPFIRPMTEEDEMRYALQRAMEERAAAEMGGGGQFRLIPSEMVPGMPPGGLVRVRVNEAPSPFGMPGMGGMVPVQGPDGSVHFVPAMHHPFGGMPMPFVSPEQEAQMQLARMMGGPPQGVFPGGSDGSGDHGNTGGMEREETPEELKVTAHLPGHHMLKQKESFDNTEAHEDAEGQSEVNPLDVKLMERTLLIRGTMKKPMPHMGEGVFVTSSFQRAVWLPANALPDKIQLSYGRKSGNLIIQIPKDPTKPEKDDADEDHPVEDQARVKKIRDSFEDFQRRVRAMQQGSGEGVRGPGAVHGVHYDDLKQRLEDMHENGEGITLEESAPHINEISRDSIEYLGCFRSWDLPRTKKQLPGHHAASFAKVMVQSIKDAQADDSAALDNEEEQYFFAIARHDAPHNSGVAFTFRRFDHAIDSQHAVTCGNHCADDGTWFCGAYADDLHHSDKCEDGVDGALFAVYALKNPKEISPRALEAAEAADLADEAKDPHPQWRLIDDFNGGDSKVEIIVPKESTHVNVEGEHESGKFAAVFADEKMAETAKVILPMEILPENCRGFRAPIEDGKKTRTITCVVGGAVFKPMKIRVFDEL